MKIRELHDPPTPALVELHLLLSRNARRLTCPGKLSKHLLVFGNILLFLLMRKSLEDNATRLVYSYETSLIKIFRIYNIGGVDIGKNFNSEAHRTSYP